jgi:hypothetical protein
MTVMVDYLQPADADGGCKQAAQGWLDLDHDASAGALRAGPLRALGSPAVVEFNLQAVRWPAAVRSDFGGYAEYLLRAMHVENGRLVERGLENTPVADLNDADREELRQWIVANADQIDQGIALVPEKFLTKRAYSVTPGGLARRANRPYRTLFGDGAAAFRAIDYSSLAVIKSPAALVRRLDELTCQGCHQSRTMEGFHVLGTDDASVPPTNALAVGTSTHLNDEIPWRKEMLARFGSGNVGRRMRPFAEHGRAEQGGYGAHCGLGDPGFGAWTCARGYHCVDVDGDEVGTCLRDGASQVGEACETSRVSASANPHADEVSDKRTLRCQLPSGGAGSCSKSDGGFPNGACTGPCARMGSGSGDAICGATPPSGFNECLATGKSFNRCLENPKPVFRRRCDVAHPCGDDYVCAGVDGAPRGVGACMPPYFIFQGRVDGHVVPVSSP